MGKFIKLVTKLHLSTKRDYIGRMFNQKVYAMKKARKFEFDYWDGKRKYGYGGYKYIPGKWRPVAKKIIKKYRLTNNSRILDVGCGKGFLLFEIKKILPNLKIRGFDISKHALKNSKPEIKKYLFHHNIKKRFPFKSKSFDLVISLNCIHNLILPDLEKSVKEIQRVGKKGYILAEGYRNEKELFNLQCWALTAECYFNDNEWKWIFKHCKYNGDYEFIYFE